MRREHELFWFVQEYYGTMPWLAVPPQRKDITSALPTKYGIMGIPCLLILSPEGELLTSAGVQAVQADPRGEKFPCKGHSAGILGMIGPLILFMMY